MMGIRTDLQSVIDRIIADYAITTGEQANANQVIEAVIGSYGGACHAIYRYIDNRLDQLFPALADEEWLDEWAGRVGIIREVDETLDSYRTRIEQALQANQQFGTISDLRSWSLAYPFIDFTYPLANTPGNGLTTIILGSYGILDEQTKTDIRLEIEAKMVAGTRLLVAQSPPQLVDFTLSANITDQTSIATVLDGLLKSSNYSINAEITIAQIHSIIDTITNDYTLISPVATVVAADTNYLKLGTITWQ